MKVLHYIPSLSKHTGKAPAFVQMLQQIMAPSMDVHIISGDLSRREFETWLMYYNPDIVHLHGCWSYSIRKVQLWTARMGYPIVLTLHEGLMPTLLHDNFWTYRVPRILAYQLPLVRKAYVLHSVSTEEQKQIRNLGWKKRIALIPYPSSTAEKQSMSEDFRKLYQKVIDTVNINQLSPRLYRYLWTILRYSVIPESETRSLTSELFSQLNSITAAEWIEMEVYATDHGVKDFLYSGAEALNIKVINRIESMPVRFKIAVKYKTFTSSRKFKRIETKYKNSLVEWKVNKLIYRLFMNIEKNKRYSDWDPPFVMLLKLYETLQFSDYEDDIINEIMVNLGITSFSGRIMQILNECLNLTTGFMPLSPINDHKTDKIRKTLNSINTKP